MHGEWIPEAVYMDSKGYSSLWFLEHRWGVQFIHRKLALVIVIFTIYLWRLSRKSIIETAQKQAINLIGLLVIIQTVLGITTLIYAAPIALALTHQIVAFFLLMVIVYNLFLFKTS